MSWRGALAVAWGVANVACGGLGEGRPNILVIFTDDQGFADLGCQGVREDVRTPHVDALAREGVRMAQGYVTAPQCAPSRASLLTGRHPQCVGVEHNRLGELHPGIPTLASRLRAAGYDTGMVGKWGLGGTPGWQDIRRGRTRTGGVAPEDLPRLPGARGFDDYFAGVTTLYAATFDLQGNRLGTAPGVIHDARYRVEVQTEAAIRFLRHRRREDRPFFLYIAHFAPHVPLEAPRAYLDRFAGVADPRRRTGLAMIACIDDGVGRIMDTLRELGLADNTLVWFISDNGAPRDHGSLNEPLAGHKGSLLDGGVRVPFIVSWRGVLPAGTVYQPMVSTLDVLPTCLAAAGVADPAGPLDGVNLLPYLAGEAAGVPHEALFFKWTSQSAIRTADWKLVRRAGQAALYRMGDGGTEGQDLAGDHPEVASELAGRLDAWLAALPEVSGQDPAARPAGGARE